MLAKDYTRVFGGDQENFRRNRELFIRYQVPQKDRSIAFDLGAGSGFQSIPLASLGCEVTAIDLCEPLLDEINGKKGRLPIRTIRDNILNFATVATSKIDYIVCMTDVISHFNSYEEIGELFRKISRSLSEDGLFFLSFRDYSIERVDTNRFIPFYSDDELIMTTFVEFGDEKNQVTDIIYRKEKGRWEMGVSSYMKLRLLPERIRELLGQSDIRLIAEEGSNGSLTWIGKIQ